MRLKAQQLSLHLSKNLRPIYWVTGNEPLQLNEACDQIRLSAKKAGYHPREIFSVEGSFNWGQITTAIENSSLFSEKKMIDIRIPSGKFGSEGAKMIIQYCQKISIETLLLISSPKLTTATLKSRWSKLIDKTGVIVQIWPVESGDLITWLQQRLTRRGLHLESVSLNLLASRVEGNLLAADQEIEKLYSLYGAGALTPDQVQTAVIDNSRFDVFHLTDAFISGRVNRAVKILQRLQSEGVAAPIILWALARESRCLIELKTTSNPALVFKKYFIWDPRKQRLQAAIIRLSLKRLQQTVILSAKADRQIKGQQAGDYWETLFKICLQLSNTRSL
jgi:DNA polymerase-3 subunit delta